MSYKVHVSGRYRSVNDYVHRHMKPEALTWIEENKVNCEVLWDSATSCPVFDFEDEQIAILFALKWA